MITTRTMFSKTSLKTFIFLAFIMFFVACGAGSSIGEGTVSSKSFTDSSDPIEMDDIVNSLPAPSLKKVDTSSTAPYYFGRFLLVRDGDLFSGSVKFRILKESDDFGYFSDFTLEHMSEVLSITTNTEIVSSSEDLEVSGSFDSSNNTVSITNATERFVSFSINFGNNDYFADIIDAGVVFSSDFTTMAGGDNEHFIFIAQKVESQPDVSEDAIEGDWSLLYFTVSGSLINSLGTGSVSVGGTGGNGFTAFTGEDDAGESFGGELGVNDETSGAFFFGLSSDGSTTAEGIDGAFLVSADENLAIGYNVTGEFYFAAER